MLNYSVFEPLIPCGRNRIGKDGVLDRGKGVQREQGGPLQLSCSNALISCKKDNFKSYASTQAFLMTANSLNLASIGLVLTIIS
jgi:hypothetical protein